MTPLLPCLHIARVVIETRTPLSIGTGRGGGLQDVALLRDANGLPAIPGTSIAGVLRHTYAGVHGQAEADSLFGHVKRNQAEVGVVAGGPATGEQASHVHVSWGAIHDARNQPVEGLKLGSDAARLSQDPILQIALRTAPASRDHVKLTAFGAAADTAKFNRAILPAGFRFSFELALWSDKVDANGFRRLLAILHDPRFRLGGATRRGLGAVEAKRIVGASFDLRRSADRERFAGLGHGLGNVAGLDPVEVGTPQSPDCIGVAIELEPVDFWRIGQGKAPSIKTASSKDPDLVPVRESVIVWDGGSAKLGERRLVVPGSGIKGALRHRTVFHYARLTGRFADELSVPRADAAGKPTTIEEFIETELAPVEALFGAVKQTARGRRKAPVADKGRAGCLLVDDVWVEGRIASIMPHNSIDRFTGGVRQGYLFTEELAEKGKIVLRLFILRNGTAIDRDVARAFGMALADLKAGRLAIGGGSARGHGYCHGPDPEWSDGGSWVNGAVA
jgi:CRISPR/Cas system CMR subunit Cmr4 (Cas7 group RAMP superfamily)